MDSISLKEHIAKIERQQSEQQRLLKTIVYYCWLQEHKVDPETIVGVLKCNPTECVMQEVKNWYRQHSLPKEEYAIPYKIKDYDNKTYFKKPERVISYKLVDGSEVCLPWPNFPDDVIYNRTRL